MLPNEYCAIEKGGDAAGVKFGGEKSEQPLVWESYRQKVETYPNIVNPPQPQPPFTDPPNYNYGQFTANKITYPRVTGPCPDSPKGLSTPYINLDEADEIGLNRMYAGVAPSKPFPGQQFLFLAKANQVEYDYVNKTKYNAIPLSQLNQATRSKLTKATGKYIQENNDYPTPDNSQESGIAKYVSFPYGTIEVKTGWRQLNDQEKPSFHTAPVRYYKIDKSISGSQENQYCYYDSPVVPTPNTKTWGMGALHIIAKTPTAPYFIFATFDQVKNILDVNGNPVEDADGTSKQPPSTQPFLPGIVVQGSTASKDLYRYVDIPSTPQGNKLSSQQFPVQGNQNEQGKVNGKPTTPFPGKYLYYENIKKPENVEYPQVDKPIAIQQRGNLIPKTISDVNNQVQKAIGVYNTQNFTNRSPSTNWQNYRLVNVQWMPLTKNTFGQPYNGRYPDSYYLANDVVESDYDLQFFSGHFYPNGTDLISDFDVDQINNKVIEFFNVFHNKQKFNMGGCMGCHGNAAVAGADSSFIFLGGLVKTPQAGGQEDSATGVKKFQRLFGVLK